MELLDDQEHQRDEPTHEGTGKVALETEQIHLKIPDQLVLIFEEEDTGEADNEDGSRYRSDQDKADVRGAQDKEVFHEKKDKEVFHEKEDNQEQEGSQDGADHEAVEDSSKEGNPEEERHKRQVVADKEDIPWEEGDNSKDAWHKDLEEDGRVMEEQILRLFFYYNSSLDGR